MRYARTRKAYAVMRTEELSARGDILRVDGVIGAYPSA